MSMVAELWLAALLQKAVRRDPQAPVSRQALHMATAGAARAIAWDDEIGTLHSVMCAGRWLPRDRTVTVLDEGAILEAAQERAARFGPQPPPWAGLAAPASGPADA